MKKLKVNTEIVKAPETEEIATVASYIEQAIAIKAPVETLERLFDLQQKAKAAAAKEAFIQSLTNFQRDCPVIEKTKPVKNKDGHTVRYYYAPIDSVIEQIRKPLSDNGLSYTWNVERVEGHMRVTCTLQHRAGHSETSTFEIPIVESQFMTSPQSYATAQSYARRYTLLNILGIGTADEDTDATDSGEKRDAKDPRAKIVFRLRALGEKTNTAKECEIAVKKLTTLDLKQENFEEIVTRLEMIIKERHENA